jgi:predicted RNase H-like nuclease (RuvC/YqgF family)
MAERPGRPTSNARGTIGGATAATRTASKDKQTTLNSTLRKTVGSALNATLNKRTTPMRQGPEAREPTSASKPGGVSRLTQSNSTLGPAAKTAELEKLLNEKTSEISSLKEEVGNLKAEIDVLKSAHDSTLNTTRDEHSREMSRLKDANAELKASQQMEIENIQEKIMNASSTS